MMIRSKHRIRNQIGANMAEFPVAFAVLIMFVFFTLVDMSTLLIGVNNVHNATRVAATDAARAANFGDMQTRARAIVNSQAGGVKIDNVDVSVFEVPIKDTAEDPDAPGGTVTLTKTKILPGPLPIIDTTTYQYQVTVAVQAQVTPLVYLNGLEGFIKITGLTTPLPVNATYSSQAENPTQLGGGGSTTPPPEE